MSVLINGMEMPSCKVGYRAYMDFRIWNDGTVEARIGPKETEYKAVPVPPHGRLIDADSKTFPTLHRNPSNDYMKGWNSCLRSVQQQPTIIPKDEVV